MPQAVPALRYVNDEEPGWRRIRRGRGFEYRDRDDRRLGDSAALERVRALAIPPAWSAVWICTDPSGHVQATGRDAKGRKQYRYHPEGRKFRDRVKFDRMVPFGAALPDIRRQMEADLRLGGLPRAKVIATLVRPLETTLVRIGNEEYARHNGAFGLTTLRQLVGAVRGVVEETADALGNTPKVCRASYIHPLVFDAFADGTLQHRWTGAAPRSPSRLIADERRLLALLRANMSRRRQQAADAVVALEAA